jgi:hypothetical protein
MIVGTRPLLVGRMIVGTHPLLVGEMIVAVMTEMIVVVMTEMIVVAMTDTILGTNPVLKTSTISSPSIIPLPLSHHGTRHPLRHHGTRHPLRHGHLFRYGALPSRYNNGVTRPPPNHGATPNLYQRGLRNPYLHNGTIPNPSNSGVNPLPHRGVVPSLLLPHGVLLSRHRSVGYWEACLANSTSFE